MRTASDLGIGGGAVALILIDHLVDAKVLTADDAKAVLAKAQKLAGTFTEGVEGARVIGEIYGRLTNASG